MKHTVIARIVLAVSILLLGVVAFWAGRHSSPPQGITFNDLHGTKIKWYSDLALFATGKRQYLYDFEVKCPNGKDLGRLQLDIDLTNGKVRVVRNDPGAQPSCVQ